MVEQSLGDRVRETERDEIAQELLAVTGEGDLVREFLLACEHVADLEGAHDLAERLGAHGPDVSGAEVDLHVLAERGFALHLVRDVQVAVLPDEAHHEIVNVQIAHFYLLSWRFLAPSNLDHSRRKVRRACGGRQSGRPGDPIKLGFIDGCIIYM